ncbi:unnamed protein product [Peniophora sp. CBMAI 1063]|nr:unnamed protein product [Peniophora sp. CBMAI 1063]
MHTELDELLKQLNLHPHGAESEEQLEPPYQGPDLAVRLICPDCRNPRPDLVEEFSSGDIVCGSCGLVLADRVVDTRSEWRTFSNDGDEDVYDPCRVGAPVDASLSSATDLQTFISHKDGNSAVTRELERAAARARDSSPNRHILSAFDQISSTCERGSLAVSISDAAKQVYKRCHDEKVFVGACTEGAVAACIYVACRQKKAARTFGEIVSLTGVDKRAIGRSFKAIKSVLKVPTQPGAQEHPIGPTTMPEEPLVRFCNQLDLPEYMLAYCKDVIICARERNIAYGLWPQSIAAGAISFMCQLLGIDRSEEEIGVAAGIGDDTIRKVHKAYFEEKNSLVKMEWIEIGRAKMERLSVSPNSLASGGR